MADHARTLADEVRAAWPHDVRRVAIGVLAEACREQKAYVRQARATYGLTSRQARRAVARLDELRAAHEAISAVQSSERTARMLLDDLVTKLDAGVDTSWALDMARDYLRGQP